MRSNRRDGRACTHRRSISIFLISPIALAGFSP
jgi:hypothetical protein